MQNKLLNVFCPGDRVGRIAETPDKLLAFEYDAEWLVRGFAISPFKLPMEKKVFIAAREPFEGNFGVFGDSLPDGWGRLLTDRMLLKKYIDPAKVSILDRLAIIGSSGMGALEYRPEEPLTAGGSMCGLDTLASEVQAILNEKYDGRLEELARVGGSSGGAKPKVLIQIDGVDWLVKFRAAGIDPKNIGKQEFAYMQAARAAGLDVPDTRLFESKYFGVRRFDRRACGEKVFMISAGGLLNADHRMPSLDYNNLMEAVLRLTRDFREARKMFRLMCFNVFAHNRDDHAKNFSFLYDGGKWQVSPAYDLVYAEGMGGERAVSGYNLTFEKYETLFFVMPGKVYAIMAAGDRGAAGGRKSGRAGKKTRKGRRMEQEKTAQRRKRTGTPPVLRTLDRFILTEMAGPFVSGIVIFTMIFVAGDLLFQAARLIIERGISLGVALRLFAYRLPEVIGLTLPMSCLLSTLLSMNRLSRDSELVALKSLGISFYRILRPVAAASFLISAASLAFNETVVPFTTQAAENLMQYEILRNQASALQEKVFLREESDGELKRVIYLDQLDPRAGIMKGVILHEFEGGRLARASVARSGVWQNGEWQIEDGQVFEVTGNGVVRLLFRFERQRLALYLSPEQLQRRTKRPVDMSARELWATIEENRATGSGLSQLLVLFHLRLAIPWACVIMAVLGASFGASQRGRSGSGVGFGISLVIVFAYYVVMSLCRALGESGNMSPFLAAWMPNALFLAVAVFFSRHVD